MNCNKISREHAAEMFSLFNALAFIKIYFGNKNKCYIKTKNTNC